MQATRKTFFCSPTLQLSSLSWGSGPPVVCLHGLADHGGVWQGLATALGHRYQVIAPDLRGHGESSKPPATDYSAGELAADLEALSQHLSLGTVSVIAHSWAAKIALLWAQHQPQRIGRLGLVDPFFVNRLSGGWRLIFPLLYRTLPFLRGMGPFPSAEAAVATARTLKQYRDWSPLQAAVFWQGLEQTPTGAWGSKFAIATRDGVFADTVRCSGLTQALSTPTRLFLPQQGLNRMAWQLRPYRQYLSHLSLQSIPGNHWPHLVAPDAFNQAVITWLQTATTTLPGPAK